MPKQDSVRAAVADSDDLHRPFTFSVSKIVKGARVVERDVILCDPRPVFEHLEIDAIFPALFGRRPLQSMIKRCGLDLHQDVPVSRKPAGPESSPLRAN